MYSINKLVAYKLADNSSNVFNRATNELTTVEISPQELDDCVTFLKQRPDFLELKQTIFRYVMSVRKDYRATTTFKQYHPEYFI